MSSQDYTFPDYGMVLEHERKAHALRAEATRDGVLATIRFFKALSARLAGRLGRVAHS
ncbi:MAG: hypothetical protein AAGA78_01185 [Pseudomonadota bacterium]